MTQHDTAWHSMTQHDKLTSYRKMCIVAIVVGVRDLTWRIEFTFAMKLESSTHSELSWFIGLRGTLLIHEPSSLWVLFQFLSVAGDQANAMFVFLVFYFRWFPVYPEVSFFDQVLKLNLSRNRLTLAGVRCSGFEQTVTSTTLCPEPCHGFPYDSHMIPIWFPYDSHMIPIWFRIQLKHVETSMDSCWNLSLESLSLLLVVISGQVYALTTCECLNGCSFVAFWCFPYYLRASWALIQHHDLEVKAIAESIPRSVEVWRGCWLDGSASVHERKKGRKEPLFIFDQQVITGSHPVPFPVSACLHHPTSQVLGLGFSGMKMGWRPRLQDIARRPTSILELTCACRLRLEAQKVALYWPKRFHQRPTSATEFTPEFLRIT